MLVLLESVPSVPCRGGPSPGDVQGGPRTTTLCGAGFCQNGVSLVILMKPYQISRSM